jgi:hypothetical protein
MNALTSNGWRWYGSGDAVHFDYVGSGSVDLRRSVLEHDGVGFCWLDSDFSFFFLPIPILKRRSEGIPATL